MAGDQGNKANPMVAFRDLIRAEAGKMAKAQDQVLLGVICAVKDGIDVEVQIDGFGSGPIDALWCVPGVQAELGMRVVCNALTGGDKWFIVAIASATTGASGKKIYYAAAGESTFVKADFPGLRAIEIVMVAGGGGGAGCTTTNSTQAASGGGGGGGAYAKRWVSAPDLAESEFVITGAGGNGGAAGQNFGSGGGFSRFEAAPFGQWCRANGGLGGQSQTPSSNLPKFGGSAGSGGTTGEGDIIIAGGAGETSVIFETQVTNVLGGSSQLAPEAGRKFITFGGHHGEDGRQYGGGGQGGVNADDQSTQRSGGDGADGIVIVELFF